MKRKQGLFKYFKGVDNMENKKVLDAQSLQQYLGIGRNATYNLLHTKGFPAIWISERRIIVPVDALEKWLEQQTGSVR